MPPQKPKPCNIPEDDTLLICIRLEVARAGTKARLARRSACCAALDRSLAASAGQLSEALAARSVAEFNRDVCVCAIDMFAYMSELHV